MKCCRSSQEGRFVAAELTRGHLNSSSKVGGKTGTRGNRQCVILSRRTGISKDTHFEKSQDMFGMASGSI